MVRIVSIKSIGIERTFSPEMQSKHHNYTTVHSGLIHKNSHSASYSHTAYKTMFLKKYFAPEWYTAVLTSAKQEKVPKYIAALRSEQWSPGKYTVLGKEYPHDSDRIQLKTINLKNLKYDYTVNGNIINQGMIAIKGLGNRSKIYEGERDWNDIDEFVADPARRNKTVMERFIKLGAFSILKGHENSKAVWSWYLYQYASGQSAYRKEIDAALLIAQGWNEQTIDAERKRQTDEYKRLYPKRNVIPPKILKWKPTPSVSREKVMALITEDFTLVEKLNFERQYLGYWLTNPMGLFKTNGGCPMSDMATYCRRDGMAFVEAIVESATNSLTKKNDRYMRLMLTDGVRSQLVFLWPRELNKQDISILKSGSAIFVPIQFDEQRHMYSVVRGGIIEQLPTVSGSTADLIIDVKKSKAKAKSQEDDLNLEEKKDNTDTEIAEMTDSLLAETGTL